MKNKSALTIEIFGKGYTVSDGLKDITTKKCSKLDKYFDAEGTSVKFIVTLEGNEYTTDMTVVYRSQTYRAGAVSDSPYNNLDVVIPRILGQLRKQKSIWGKRGVGAIKKKTTVAAETKSEDVDDNKE